MEPVFFQRTGIMTLGSRLRRLSERITADSAAIYRLQGLQLEPRWFPVLYTLGEDGPLHVTELADRIGQSHAAVSQVANQLKKKGWLRFASDPADGRKRVLELTETGRALLPQLENLYGDVTATVEEVLGVCQHDFWAALQEMENALDDSSLYDRLRRRRRSLAATATRLLAYEPRYRQAFYELNREWIDQYFKMEEADHQVLDDPEGYILSKGGEILVALHQEEPVGVCALIKVDDDTFELGKMAVSPRAQGLGIGRLLGQGIIERARARGARRLVLESNTKLTPAISLYHSLGFRQYHATFQSVYQRSNIAMEMWFDQ